MNRFGHTLSEYMNHTKIASGSNEVTSLLYYYIWSMEEKKVPLAPIVTDVIDTVLSHDELLQHTHIVALAAYRDQVLMIYPNDVSFPDELKDGIQALKNWKQHMGILSICLNMRLLNKFIHPTAMIEETISHAKQLIENKPHLQQALTEMKKNKINQYLDEYNQTKDLQVFTKLKQISCIN